MADLARVRIGRIEKNMSRSLAERTEGVKILDESPYRGDGSLRAESRVDGRRSKPKTSVAEAAAKKNKAADQAASTADAESTPPTEEQS